MLRVLLLVSCLLAASHAAPKHHPEKAMNRNDDDQTVKFKSDLDQKWKEFKLTHAKTYSGSEEEKRKQVFADNLKEIAAHNQLYERNLTTWKMGVNQFTDLTTDEFVKAVTCLPQQNLTTLSETFRNLTSTPPELFPANSPLPSAVDWRSRGYVTRVKNQGHCGSCWSFASIGALESVMWLKTGEEVYLSEQQLVDCSTRNGGCYGGWPHWALDYIRQNGGVDTEDAYQYEAEDGRCRYNSRLNGGRVDGWVMLPWGSESLFQRAIAFAGPVAVAIDASPFHHYASGIMNSWRYPRLNHAVLLVGYNSLRPGTDYWIFKNSWGTGWGMDGYALLARNSGNNCGIGTYGTYPRVF